MRCVCENTKTDKCNQRDSRVSVHVSVHHRALSFFHATGDTYSVRASIAKDYNTIPVLQHAIIFSTGESVAFLFSTNLQKGHEVLEADRVRSVAVGKLSRKLLHFGPLFPHYDASTAYIERPCRTPISLNCLKPRFQRRKITSINFSKQRNYNVHQSVFLHLT